MDDCDRCCHTPRGLATGTHCLSFRHDRLIDRLQALRVVLVGLLAGGSAGAGGRASVADSLRCQSVCAVGKKVLDYQRKNTYTALSVLLGNTAAATGGGGGGSRAGGGSGGPDAGGSGPGGAAGRRPGRGRRAAARGAATRLESTGVGRADRASLDVRVGDGGTRGLRLDICGLSGSDGASTAGNTRFAWVSVGGVRGVQPVLS
jgi:hypothetical protein